MKDIVFPSIIFDYMVSEPGLVGGLGFEPPHYNLFSIC